MQDTSEHACSSLSSWGIWVSLCCVACIICCVQAISPASCVAPPFINEPGKVAAVRGPSLRRRQHAARAHADTRTGPGHQGLKVEADALQRVLDRALQKSDDLAGEVLRYVGQGLHGLDRLLDLLLQVLHLLAARTGAAETIGPAARSRSPASVPCWTARPGTAARRSRWRAESVSCCGPPDVVQPAVELLQHVGPADLGPDALHQPNGSGASREQRQLRQIG